MLSFRGEIRRDDGCLDYGGGRRDMNKNDRVIVYKCHEQEGNQHWVYTEVSVIKVLKVIFYQDLLSVE